MLPPEGYDSDTEVDLELQSNDQRLDGLPAPSGSYHQKVCTPSVAGLSALGFKSTRKDTHRLCYLHTF